MISHIKLASVLLMGLWYIWGTDDSNFRTSLVKKNDIRKGLVRKAGERSPESLRRERNNLKPLRRKEMPETQGQKIEKENLTRKWSAKWGRN